MKASIITVGDEILIGQITDTNSAWLAAQLNLLGVQIRKMISVGDEAASIYSALEECMSQDVLVVMTGGLGPTKDDITKKVIADFLGLKMSFSQESWTHIQQFFRQLGRTATEAHYNQCFMPEGVRLLDNKMGTAPGMWFEKGNAILVSLPGVPYEMKSITANQLLPRLQHTLHTPVIEHRTLLTVGMGESLIAEKLAAFEDSLPNNIKLAYLPNLARVRLRLSAVGEDRQMLRQELEKKVEDIRQLLGDLVYGEGEEELAQKVGEMLKDRKITLATAESCTGGYVSHLITGIAGSSDYYHGSIITYSNELKMKLLGVKKETLDEFGAVSEQTVKEMVTGLLQAIPVGIGISVSGIAGPGGGSAEKPVGTIWMAISDGKIIQTQKLSLGKDRLINIKYAGIHAVNMIRKFLLAQ